MSTELCPCGSGKNFADCCEPIIKAVKKAETPEALMRARYSAYAKAEIDFIVDSTHPDQRETNDRSEIKRWAENSRWQGLEIISTEKGGAKDQTGIVEFIARYNDRGVNMEHHEISEFRRYNDDWYFYDGAMVQPKPFVRTQPKISPNDPCTCGSGKKYKKCCGK